MRSLKSWSAFVVLCVVLVPGQLNAATKHVNGKIAFHTNRDGNNEIYVMNQDGTAQTRLTNDPASDSGAAWSPDGSKILFNRSFDIFVMNADGSNPVRLAAPGATNAAPAWSPDGTRIAFHSSRDGNFEIYVMNADGSGQTRLTHNAAGDFTPSWSPDGQRIVFRSDRDGNNEIYVMASDGTAQLRLTANTLDDQEPHFSGDGTRVVFTRRVVSTRQIMVMDGDGSNVTQLTSAGNNFVPAVSPDGRKITFASDRDGNHEIYSMNADGSAQVRLTANTAIDDGPAGQPLFLPATVGVYRPATGQWLLRTANTGGSANLAFTFGGQPGDLPVPGDWNGDGRTDLGVFRDGTFIRGVIKISLDCFHCLPITTIDQLEPLSFGQADDRPIAGDWNGDGIDDVGVYRSNTSTFLLRVPQGTVHPCLICPPIPIFITHATQFGSAGDLPVAGDWDGDGKDAIGVFHEGVFLLTNDFSETNASSVFGFIGDLPLTGDWIGIGRHQLGLFHPPTATMSLETKLGEGPDINFTFGSAGDLPVAGHWTAVAP